MQTVWQSFCCALINDLTTGCLVHTFVNYTTLSEVLEHKSHDSNMNTFIENLMNWADQNDMQINRPTTI